MAESNYDVIVIGGGPGGYVCAIRCAQLGMKVACVEKRKTYGGTCLNVGCIPSKALLHASERFEEAGLHFKTLGIKCSAPELDLKAMMRHKDSVVADNVKGIDFLFKKNKIDAINGLGQIAASGEVVVGKHKYKAKHIVIATGSDVAGLPGLDIDEEWILSSEGALSLPKVPKSLVVIGAGVIGLELGSVWRRLGAEVTVVEYMDRILPGMDVELAREGKKLFERQGLKFKLSTKVTGAKTGKRSVTLTIEPAAGGGDAQNLEAERVLVCVGRRAFTKGLGLEHLDIALDQAGRIEVDDRFETGQKGIYAIGDVIKGPMLAHKAEEEGVVLAEILAGQSGHVDYNIIPSVVYTVPEIASVGQNEEQLKEAGIAYKVGKFPFMANGRARAMNAAEGFVKILAESKTDRVLGVHIIGPEAGTLIGEATMAMEFGASSEDIARTCHAHPTLEETIKEAALAVDGRALHS